MSATWRRWLPPFAGLFAYGGWALWVNLPFGENAAFKAALAQGGYSFFITLVINLLAEALLQKMQGIAWRHFWVFTCLMSALVLGSFSVHLLAGTPQILWTLLPSLLMSAIHTGTYLFWLR